MAFQSPRSKALASPPLSVSDLDPDDLDLSFKTEGSPPSALASEIFNAPDADVTFISSDNVLFKIHSKNLDTHACGFPPSDIGCSPGEFVPLTEDSMTLEHLFSFIYPRRHPDLRSIPFDQLAAIAEAAEKYEVFAAMNICEIRMRTFLPEHAQEIMVYAAKHGYPEITGLAAPALLDIPLEVAVSTFPLSLVRPWVAYYQSYTNALMQSFLSPAIHVKVYTGGFGSSGFHLSNDGCTICARDLDAAMRRAYAGLGGKRSMSAVEAQIKAAFHGAQHVSGESWLQHWRGKVQGLKGFETLL